jgi:hypothetical protein
MTIPKKIKGVPFHKKDKPTYEKPFSKKSALIEKNRKAPKNLQKNIHIDYDDEFLNNFVQLSNILE